MAWVDVEAALLDQVADLASGGTRLPLNLGDNMPFIHCRRVGGSDRGWDFTARIVLTIFAPSRGTVWDLAEQIADRLLSDQHSFIQGGVALAVESESGNAEVPNADPATGYRQIVATYRITAQRP